MDKFWTIINVPVGEDLTRLPYYSTLAAAQAAAQEEADKNYKNTGFAYAVVIMESVKAAVPPTKPDVVLEETVAKGG